MTTGGFDIRLAESQDDYRAFTEIAREYIVSLGFEIDFQDVNLDMAEARRRYGKSGGGPHCWRLRRRETSSALPRSETWAKACAS